MGKSQHGVEFAEMIAPIVQECCKIHGWGVPSAIIAQAITESVKSTGLSGLATTCYNYWGMKYNSKYGCGYKEYPTKEQRPDGIYYTVNSKFCKVNSVREGIELYFKFIEMNPRYKRVMTSRTFTEYATMLKECGWATSIKYTQSIVNNVLLYNTAIYDENNIPSAKAEEPIKYAIGKVYTLKSNLYIRTEPFGEKMKYECITQDARNKSHFDDYGCAILEKDSRVSCLAVKELPYSTWLLIPSGWVCAYEKGKVYIE